MYQTDLYDVVLGVAVVRPHPLLEEHAQREVLLEQGQHLLDRDADGSQDSRLCPLFAWCYLKGIANILLKSKLFRISVSFPGFLVPAGVQDRPPAELDEDVAEGGVADRSYPPLKRGRWEAGEI